MYYFAEVVTVKVLNSYTENIGAVENKGFELAASLWLLRDTERRVMWSITWHLTLFNFYRFFGTPFGIIFFAAYNFVGADPYIIFFL